MLIRDFVEEAVDLANPVILDDDYIEADDHRLRIAGGVEVPGESRRFVMTVDVAAELEPVVRKPLLKSSDGFGNFVPSFEIVVGIDVAPVGSPYLFDQPETALRVGFVERIDVALSDVLHIHARMIAHEKQ
jgi:hypothetical protein